MSGVRKLYLDHCIGERRAVVTLDGKPERLLIEREHQFVGHGVGARLIARVARVERALGTAFLETPDGEEAVTPLGSGMVEGAAVEIEVTAQARVGKSAVARVLGASSGPPRLVAEAPSLEARLLRYAAGPIVEGADARDVADDAQVLALAVEHRLPGGGSIAIEPTRALTAIDVDQGGRTGGDARRAARQTNLAAIATGARLLRLKGIGGLVVFDLVGKGHDGPALSAAARLAFEPDGPQVSIGPISRFGLFELSLPRGGQPALEILAHPDGRATELTRALDMVRAVEREWRANPGARLKLSAPENLVTVVRPYLFGLTERFGVVCELAARETDDASYEVVAR